MRSDENIKMKLPRFLPNMILTNEVDLIFCNLYQKIMGKKKHIRLNKPEDHELVYNEDREV